MRATRSNLERCCGGEQVWFRIVGLIAQRRVASSRSTPVLLRDHLAAHLSRNAPFLVTWGGSVLRVHTMVEQDGGARAVERLGLSTAPVTVGSMAVDHARLLLLIVVEPGDKAPTELISGLALRCVC